MKLYANATSPYVRVVRMVIEELGLGSRVELQMVRTRIPECPVNAVNPTGKIPTLVTDDDHVLSESRLICQYLDILHAGDPVVDHDPEEAPRVFEGVVIGFIDGISVWVRELARPENERSPSILEQERARADRCVTWFERRAGDIGERVDYPRACLASALYSLEEQLQDRSWREQAPGLAAWYQRFTARPSFRATIPAG